MPKLPNTDHAVHRLTQQILALSESDAWQEARSEWELVDVFFAEKDNPSTCLCGHFPIIECCALFNRRNGNRVVVGNVCVKRFMRMPSDKLFRALARIAEKRDAALSTNAVEHVFGKGWINDWEKRFCLDTCRKRRLSERQRAKREEINARILYHVHRPQE